MQLIQILLKNFKIVIPLILISILIGMCGKLDCKKMEDVSLTPNTDDIIDTIEKIIPKTIDTLKEGNSIEIIEKKEPKKIQKKYQKIKRISKNNDKDTSIIKENKVELKKKITNCGCIGKAAPTKAEAQIWAFEINKCARKYIRKNDYKNLLLYAMDGIRLYENSSLFYLKSLAYFYLGNFDYSLTAAEVSKANNDYWIIEDKKAVYQIIIDNLKAKDYQTPSRYNKQLIIEAKNEYKKIFN